MKLLSNLLLLTVLLTGLGLSAAPISFGTAITGPGVSEGNAFNLINVPTVPAGAWHAPIGPSLWESIQPNSLSPSIPNGTVVDFYFFFTLAGTPTGGSLGLLVDDNAKVVLNGVTIANNMGSPLGAHCSATLPNCVTVLTLDISSQLVSGINRLDVFAEQDGNAQYGLDVYGTASFRETSGVPEPASLGLIGSGLLGLGLLRRRK